MVVTASLVGMRVEPMVHDVDARWTMAYAAAIDDLAPTYMDTTGPDGIVAHPVFAVCPEWPVIVASRDAALERGLTPAEVLTSIHATHDTTIHRLVRPGDRLTTSLEIVAMTQITPGAMSSTRLQTTDADGAPVTTTTQNGIYLAQPLVGAGVVDPEPPVPLVVERCGEPIELARTVAGGAAHTYTECARIWNPIHTDRAAALAAGLPDIVLHGTANLAIGVSGVVEHRAERRPELVRRISCRFAAMVRLPSALTVRVWTAVRHGDGVAVPFEVLNEAGEPAVKDGVVLLGEPMTANP